MPVSRSIDALAKINLALHVTGQRADGYHLIETIAVFAEPADRITVAASDTDRFQVVGPEAGAIASGPESRNLVVRARDMMRDTIRKRGCAPPVSITLEKSLPAGAGLGGGSADAAATIRALVEHWQIENLPDAIIDRLAALGADVPMCFEGRPLLASGIGDRITHLSGVPRFPVVLVNPRQHVSTPDVFGALARKQNPGIKQEALATLRSLPDWIEWLSGNTRNDLEEPASNIAPAIASCMESIECSGAQVTRMSGSGATCFGIYKTWTEAEDAAERLLRQHPDWWITATMTEASPKGHET
jgi:4-diphosphocytidyl-2-C-methyl-D-erythritol kinase